MVTQQDIENMPPETVFKIVVMSNVAQSMNRDEDGQLIPVESMFICKRGRMPDWTIYGLPLLKLMNHIGSTDYFELSHYVEENGDKITMEHNVRNISGCDDTAYKTYRL